IAMYLEFYGLRKAPFQITPDPDFLFLSPSHKVALGAIIYGIEERQGFVVITGEVGLGKTTILRSYLERVDPHQLRTICIFNANVSFEGLLKTLYAEFDLEYHTDDLFENVKQLHSILIQEYEQGRNVALIIDEAQNMPIETLSHLLMLSNLETSTEKLLQIVLIGQPEFENTLNRQELRQLKQRLVIHEKIDALTSQESLAYIHHRLDKVKTHTEPIFHHKAEALLIKASKGTPRVLNTLCTNALIAGVGYQEKPVSTRTIKQVTDNLLGTRRTSTGLHPWRYLFVALGILLLLCILWLSPIGKYITRPPMIPAARDMLLTRFKGFMPSWIQAKLPKSDPMVSPAPEPIAPPAPEPMAEPPEPIPPEPEPPVVSTSTQKPEDADPQPSTEQSDDPSRNGLQPEDIPEEPVDTEDNGFPLTISVSPGEDISDIALEIYGFANDELFDLIKQSNPNVEDLKSIKVGDKLLLPALPKALEKYRGT
uniref:ExeA family protein n=1 Tax=Candidatus Entotheonella palauensis TaxID=93172 RepID=UPI000B80218E